MEVQRRTVHPPTLATRPVAVLGNVDAASRLKIRGHTQQGPIPRQDMMGE
jgi:hypothetical protein